MYRRPAAQGSRDAEFMASLAAVTAQRYSDSEEPNFGIGRRRVYPTKKAPNLPFVATVCLGVVALLAGFGFLFSSLFNKRVQAVRDYDAEVEHWQDIDRPRMEQLQVNLLASLPPTQAGSAPITLRSSLEPTEEDDWVFSDSEDGYGIEEYKPLSYRGRVELPCYYNNCSMVEANWRGQLSPRDQWDDEVLPSWDEAPRAGFLLMASGGGLESNISLDPLPLVYDFPTVGQAPQPRTHCFGTSHGVYKRPGACHHAHKLVDLCVAVSFDGEAWTLHHFATNSLTNSSRHTGSYGCNPQRNYEPTTYKKDMCWGAAPSHRLCEEAGPAHILEITVRAWHDPYIRAAELTHGTFDFGLAPATQVKIGVILLVFGTLAACCPCFIRRNCHFKGASGAEEREVLSPQAQKLGMA
ncbi:unnamed protein product [Symbiodinium sp. CCMP2592]|nr:unnamed protein product [Symbiodinium sp. CCMP2592]